MSKFRIERKRIEVQLPFDDEKYYITQLSATDLIDYVKYYDDEFRMFALIFFALVNESNERVLTTDEDMKALKDWPASLVSKLYAVADKLNSSDAEIIKKN